MIDLRSDTVTRPTPDMRRAMAEAQVGDAVFGDDPTVQALEARTAEILGKEAALYMPSGTMTNQVAIRTHTESGDEVLMDVAAHLYVYEVGAPAALSGVTCKLLPGQRGVFTAADVKAALRSYNVHYPPTKLVCVENTHNVGGGAVWPLQSVAEVSEAARQAGLRVHMDGARLWNASVASGVSEGEYARHFDSVSVCFSKGLGAPVGSALAGSRDFIERARRFRKQFGGGMRQAGIIAAGALYALEHHRARLAEDHANARRLAEGIADLPGIKVNPAEIETNILFWEVTQGSAQTLADRLKAAGVWVTARGTRIRAVTHLDVNADQIEQTIRIIRETVLSAK